MGRRHITNRLLWICLWVVIPSLAIAQPFSNRGREFWVGYGHHQYMELNCTGGIPGDYNTMDMVLYLSTADQAATVTVTIDRSGPAALPVTWWRRTYNIPANTVISTETYPATTNTVSAGPVGPFPKGAPSYDSRLVTDAPPAGTGGEGIFKGKGIHIESNVPIVAYAHIYAVTNSGATMLMPVNTWGYAYTSMNSEQGGAVDRSYSWMYVVAKDSNTRVTITPSAPSRMGKPQGVPFDVLLQKGEIYQYIGQADCATGTGPELTGTTVKSIAGPDGICHPIAVFGGSSRTGGEAALCGSSGRDNDMQQLFPEHAWGMLYLTAPFSKAGGATLFPNQFQTSVYKIVVKDPATVVRRNGAILNPSTLINGHYYKFSSNTADYITSDKPVMVAQFMPGGGTVCNTGAGGDGDPEMVIISPTEQASKKVSFFRNTKFSINSNYLTLIVPTAGLPSLRIDNSTVFDHTYTHSYPNQSYTVVVKGWPAAQAQCNVSCDSGFNAITYGLGGAESYGYNAGTNILNLNGISEIHNLYDSVNKSSLFTCTKTPVEISALISYKPTKLEWKLSSLGAALTPNADVTQVNPIAKDSIDVNGFRYYKYTLPDQYVFNAPGTYYFPLIATSPTIDVCTRMEEFSLEIVVKQSPTADFTYTQGGCRMDSVFFTALNTTGNGYTVDRWRWAYPDGETDSIQNPKHRFATAGQHNVYLKVITPEGCMGDTTKTITLSDLVVNASIVSSTDSICVGGSITFTDTSTTAGINAWYWDLGNGTVDTVYVNTPQTTVYNDYGSFTVKHLAYLPGGGSCAGDTLEHIVTILAKPRVGFTYPAGCLPPNGVVQFTDTTNTPDAQPITSWNWSFNDPASTGPNPNTSTQQNPTHIYTSFGTYNIALTASTEKGCTNSVTVPATFNVQPQLTYAALPAVCESVTGTVSVATASVTNGVTGKGVYSGTGTDAAGNFTPSVAGAGTHTITYTFTSDGSCTVTTTSTITVHPKPVALFTISNNICLDELAAITPQATVPTGSITSWVWDFGDGNTATYNNNNAFTKTYTVYSDYNVQLTVHTNEGCEASKILPVSVHPLPVVDFMLPVGICMPGGEAKFTNLTTLPDNGTLTYSWNFGDGGGVATATDATHIYAAGGTYNVMLTATSAYGCDASATKVVLPGIFLSKPIAVFTVSPVALCQGNDHTFTDQSTAANSTVTGRKWAFGDGQVSTEQDPVHRYRLPGEYTISLEVSNAAGCTSDPITHSATVYLQPVIDAGPSFVVAQGTTVRFNPVANDSTVVTFEWTPATDLSNSKILRPSMMATEDRTYRLTAMGEGNCSAWDEMSVKILRTVKVPNAFSPNGDGVNDVWRIDNLSDYAGCTVEVFNRYGQRVFYSGGYGVAWDGRYNGSPLPVATYYYVIHLKNGFQPLTGSITILR